MPCALRWQTPEYLCAALMVSLYGLDIVASFKRHLLSVDVTVKCVVMDICLRRALESSVLLYLWFDLKGEVCVTQLRQGIEYVLTTLSLQNPSNVDTALCQTMLR